MAQASRRQPKAQTAVERDPPVAQGADLTVLTAMRQYRLEAQDARKERLRLNKRNWDVFMGVRDHAHKIKGQSRETLPELAMAKEQISAFIERGLTDFGDWFSVNLHDETVMTSKQAERLMQYQLDHASSNGVNIDEDFPAVVADTITSGLLGSLMILKIGGRTVTEWVFRAERGVDYLALPDGSIIPQITQQLIRKEMDNWQLVIDLIPPENYLPDPTGRGLYEMHEVERDLSDVLAMADAGVYDRQVIEQIEGDFAAQEERSYSTREIDREGHQDSNPSFRKRIVLCELWGDILDERGRKVEYNVVCTMANDKYLIRPPEPNPYWHGERPFVTRPLIRVPFSVWHKALFDHAVALNLALEELYNLMFDGGMASVWGNKQIRPEFLEDPQQVKDGVPQGMTLIVREGVPAGVKVLEDVSTGRVPGDAMGMFQLTRQSFERATQVNAVSLGQTPGGGTTATAVVQAQQQSNLFFDGMIRDAEKMIGKALYLGWCNMMQFWDDLDAKEVITAIGERAAVAMGQMSAAERYEMFAGCKFKVSGLSATMARMRDFQKLMTLLGAISQAPMLMVAFLQKYSPQKVIGHMFKSLNLDPASLEPDEQERATMPQTMQQVQQLMGVAPEGQGGVGGGGPSAPPEAPGDLPIERMPAEQAGGY